MKYICILAVVLFIAGCSNLPKPGWHTKNGSTEKVYVMYLGSQEDIKAQYPGTFEQQHFVAAMDASPSSRFMSAGRPRYYVVLGNGPDARSGLQIITLEILERDYK